MTIDLEAADFNVEYIFMQGDEFCASSTDPKDAEHYAAVYGQDGPVQRQTAVTFTFDEFLDHDAIRDAHQALQAGEKG